VTKPNLQAVDPNSPTGSASDPFDLASLRLNSSFVETAGVKPRFQSSTERRVP